MIVYLFIGFVIGWTGGFLAFGHTFSWNRKSWEPYYREKFGKPKDCQCKVSYSTCKTAKSSAK